MINPAFVYILVSAVLFTIACVVHFHSAALSLPVSPAISILATILPIAAFLNAFIHPSLLQRSHQASSSSSSSSSVSSRRVHQLAPLVLQTLQALVTTILATLLLEQIIPSPGLECRLENRWMGMYRAHDANGVRRIQDALDCCGLNSVKDRAYPFPHGAPSTCAETYGRSVACRGSWRSALQTTAGVDFGVVLAVGLMQILGLLLMREGSSWWTAWRPRGGAREVNGAYESRRPLLLPTSSRDEETVERQESGPRSYGAVNGGSGIVNGDETGPRVEPSPITEGNAWNDDGH